MCTHNRYWYFNAYIKLYFLNNLDFTSRIYCIVLDKPAKLLS